MPAVACRGQQAANLIGDSSFEIPKDRDQFGLVFAKWGGWKYEGDCSFAVGKVARSGRHSCLLVGGAGAKIRTAQLLDPQPGRYRVTAWLRGLDIGTGAIRCTECAYRNLPAWKMCYACGTPLKTKRTAPSGPPVKLITSLEDKNPFNGGEVVQRHATDGTKSLRIDKSYVVMDGPQDWSGYDYLKADLHVETDEPLQLYVEIRDAATRDYSTRVNYITVAPPGRSTLTIPVKQLYVGEKSRPGRMLMLGSITPLVLSIGDRPKAPLFLDNVRLERDASTQGVTFDGLYAFDFGSSSSPAMDGFVRMRPNASSSLMAATRASETILAWWSASCCRTTRTTRW